jgi:hypothetical protein
MLRISTLIALLFSAPLLQVDTSTDAILWALRLPALVTEARQVGVPEVVVGEVLDGLRRRGLPAGEAALVVREEVDAVKDGEPKDNFGAFVQSQLDAGLRGRALAQAIHAEHQARGVGHSEGRKPQKKDTTGSEGRRP